MHTLTSPRITYLYFLGYVPPYALQEILAALATDSPGYTTYFWAFITFIAHLSFAQKDLFQSWHTRRCYERTRGQLFCALHYKSLRRQDVNQAVRPKDDTESGNADLGKIVNLMQCVFLFAMLNATQLSQR